MNADEPFFIGWDADVPRPLQRFVVMAAAAIVIAMPLLALALGRASDAGAGDIVGDAAIAGILELKPYPLVRAAPDVAHPAGRALMLAGEGKYGVDASAMAFAGQPVEARGLLVKRGDLDMLLVAPDGVVRAAAPTAAPAPAPVQLGTWRVSGEICDGKCNAGVMRPGRGLAHKACASLCVSGGVPAVFVATAPVAGASFLLLADKDGGPPPKAMFDLAAIPVSLEGQIERRGDLAVFRVDWSRARAL